MNNKVFLSNGKMRIEYVYLIRFIFTGLLWILYGFTNIKSQTVELYSTLSRVFMILAVLCICVSYIVKREEADTYAKEYLAKASEYVLSFFSFLIMIAICFIPFVKDMTLDLKLVLPFALGGILFSVGIIFEYLEEALFFEK